MGIIIRQSIKGTIVTFIGSFIGFLTQMFVVTKFLQTEEIGLIQIILQAALFFSVFAQLGTSNTAFRFFPYFQSANNNNNGFFFYMVLLPTIGICIFIPLFILLKEPITAYYSTNAALFTDYYYWVLLLAIFIVFWTTFETYSNLLMRIAIPKFLREVAVKVLTLIVYILFIFKFLNLNGFVGCFIAIYGVVMLLSFFYVSRIGSVSLKHDFSFIDKPLRKKIKNYTLFLLLSAMSGSILGQLDLFMVGAMEGLSQAGIYTIMFFMAAVVDMPYRSITAISSPIAAKALKEGNMETANQLFKKVSLHQLVAGSCVFLLLWINIDNIFQIIPNGNVYAVGKWVVFFLVLGRLLSITVNFGATIIAYSKYYYWTLFFSIFITITGVITNLILIPRMGMTGAAIATLTSTILSCGVQQWIVMKKIKGNPFSMSMLKLIILILILFGINYLLPHWTSNPFIDLPYRTLIIGSITVISLYKLKISDEISGLIGAVLGITVGKKDNDVISK